MAEIKDIQVVDNYLPSSIFTQIQEQVLSPSFPWYFNEDISGFADLDSINNYGFAHVSFKENQPNSQYNDLFMPMVHYIEERFNLIPRELSRIRLAMRTKSSDLPLIDGIHTDLFEPHYTLLVYLNDADGNTILYNKKYTLEGTATFEKFAEVETKANRAVLFNGLIPHAASHPTKVSRRVAANINFHI